MRQLITTPGQVGEILRGRRKARRVSQQSSRPSWHQPEPLVHARRKPGGVDLGSPDRSPSCSAWSSSSRTRQTSPQKPSGEAWAVAPIAERLESGPMAFASDDGSSRRAAPWSSPTTPAGRVQEARPLSLSLPINLDGLPIKGTRSASSSTTCCPTARRFGSASGRAFTRGAETPSTCSKRSGATAWGRCSSCRKVKAPKACPRSPLRRSATRKSRRCSVGDRLRPAHRRR